MAGGQVLFAPDNGVLSLYLQQFPLDGAWAIQNRTLMRDEVSPTFHGRDVFAVVAGAVALGASLSAVGPRVTQLVTLELPEVRRESTGAVCGEIIQIDRFGNAITNIQRKDLETGWSYRADVGGHSGLQFAETYGHAPKGTPLALWGSSGRLELAVTEGNAARTMALTIGMPVTVYSAGRD
jgi:S-adenosylmethionine hydrolase